MEPITLCGAVAVVFGLWVEYGGIIMKGIRAISGSTIMRTILPSMKEQRAVVTITPGGCRGYRTGNSLVYRVARS